MKIFFLPGAKNYTGKIYLDKVGHLATIISQIGIEVNPKGIAFIGVAEIENDTVLNDLRHHPLLAKRNYGIVHYDSRDSRGIDVALLYNPEYFTVLDSRKLFVHIPSGSKNSYFTRDVLWVKASLMEIQSMCLSITGRAGLEVRKEAHPVVLRLQWLTKRLLIQLKKIISIQKS